MGGRKKQRGTRRAKNERGDISRKGRQGISFCEGGGTGGAAQSAPSRHRGGTRPPEAFCISCSIVAWGLILALPPC